MWQNHGMLTQISCLKRETWPDKSKVVWTVFTVLDNFFRWVSNLSCGSSVIPKFTTSISLLSAVIWNLSRTVLLIEKHIDTHCVLCLSVRWFLCNHFQCPYKREANNLYINKKRIGPKTYPCGRPVLLYRDVFKFCNWTHCCQYSKYELSQVTARTEKWNWCLNLLKSISWFTVSKAFFKSKNTAPTTFLLSSGHFILSTKWHNAVSVEHFLWKPNCLEW